jgi:hypothetical protein
LGEGEAADVKILVVRLGGVLCHQGACNGKTDGCYYGCAELDFVVLWYVDCCGGAGNIKAEGAMFKTSVEERSILNTSPRNLVLPFLQIVEDRHCPA